VGDHLTRVVVLGSTGSIGCQTLEVIRALPERFRVVGLAAGNNLDLLAEQVGEFRPAMVSCLPAESLRPRLDALSGHRPEQVDINTMATSSGVDVVVSAIVGAAGLEPTLAALEAGKVVALANKEAMVMAGNLLAIACRKGGGEIRPIDSEHSAIWQCLVGEDRKAVRRLIITASGGALRDLPQEELPRVTAEQALVHPNWRMGRRITIDSATLFNKGLEVIEARWLFDLPFDRIDVLMHRESVVHSMVEFVDGSVKAQLGLPDMRLPIQYALCYPERLAAEVPAFDLAAVGSLHFDYPDFARYPCLSLALDAGRRSGTYPTALAAADEVAVEAFVAGEMGFMDIPRLLADTLDSHVSRSEPSLPDILEADAWAREYAREWRKSRR
jgi:1-deoxy-D-xylulose-5-phosphate reductoisomerase